MLAVIDGVIAGVLAGILTLRAGLGTPIGIGSAVVVGIVTVALLADLPVPRGSQAAGTSSHAVPGGAADGA